MAESEQGLDVAALQRDIHGHRVVSARLCDYCGGTFEIDEPVLYEVARLDDTPGLVQVIGDPQGWFPDAARRRDCERETVDPATAGIAEALIMINLTESNGLLRLDATDLTVVDYSPAVAGYEPPKGNLEVLIAAADVGLVRWSRVKAMLELDDGTSDLVAKLRMTVNMSQEIPPGIE